MLSMIIYTYIIVMWKYVFFLIMLDYDYVLMCVVLELIHDFSYFIIWVHNGYIDYFIVVDRMT